MRAAHREPAVGGCGCGFDELTLDLAELRRRDATEANANSKSAVPLLGCVGHGLARHPMVGQRLQLRSMPSRSKRRVSSDSDDVEDATPEDEARDEFGDLSQHGDVRLREVCGNGAPSVAERSERTVRVGPVIPVRHEPGDRRKKTCDVTDIVVDIGVICDSPERTAHKERPSVTFSERGLQVGVARNSLPARVVGRSHESKLWVAADIGSVMCSIDNRLPWLVLVSSPLTAGVTTPRFTVRHRTSESRSSSATSQVIDAGPCRRSEPNEAVAPGRVELPA